MVFLAKVSNYCICMHVWMHENIPYVIWTHELQVCAYTGHGFYDFYAMIQWLFHALQIWCLVLLSTLHTPPIRQTAGTWKYPLEKGATPLYKPPFFLGSRRLFSGVQCNWDFGIYCPKHGQVTIQSIRRLDRPWQILRAEGAPNPIWLVLHPQIVATLCSSIKVGKNDHPLLRKPIPKDSAPLW